MNSAYFFRSDLGSQHDKIRAQEEQNSHRTGQKWSTEETNLLLKGIEEFGKQWQAIVDKHFTSSDGDEERTAKGCKHRWEYLQKSDGKQRQVTKIPDKKTLTKQPHHYTFINVSEREILGSNHWSIQEDELLLKGIQEFGNQWQQIAQKYFSSTEGHKQRNFKSCYSRYKLYWEPLYSIEKVQAIQGGIQVKISNIGEKKVRRIANLFEFVRQEVDISPIPTGKLTVSHSQHTGGIANLQRIRIPSTYPLNDLPRHSTSIDPLLPSPQSIRRKRSHGLAFPSESPKEENDLKRIKTYPIDSPIFPVQTSEERMNDAQETIHTSTPSSQQDRSPYLDELIDQDIIDSSQLDNFFTNLNEKYSYLEDFYR